MELQMPDGFKNEQYVDFLLQESREMLAKTLDVVERQLGKTYPLIIGGKKISEGKKYAIRNPGNHDEVLGEVYFAAKEHADQAIAAAEHAFESWQNVPYYERTAKLLKAAELARKQKLELSVWLSKENGKSMPEAVADIAEGIDFMDYYARLMNGIGSKEPALTHVQGEKNKLVFIPLGAGAIIAPWNFPFAIFSGMASAAIVTGNTAIVKPSSITPIIGYKFFELLEEAGFPAGIANYLPGNSVDVGDYLVEHPRIRFVSFTGSTIVGKRIYEKASKFAPGQHWFKRVVLETGGKNFAIVCEDADINEAVRGVMHSAFGYNGQKCSACSIALIHKDIYDVFLKKLKKETENLKIGIGTDPENFIGPLSSHEQLKKVLEYLDIAQKEAKIVSGGKKLSSGFYNKGYYIEPAIIQDVKNDSKIFKEEIFGPVLAVNRMNSFEEAIELQRKSDYGLTGGIFTKNSKYKELAKRRFHTGNLYINKSSGATTGAMVARQPFGGFNLSGTGGKTGGPNYLYLYMQEKSITEFG